MRQIVPVPLPARQSGTRSRPPPDHRKSYYVVATPNWNILRGAVTLGSGSTGIVGTISAVNSLVGAIPGDHDSRRLVASPRWK